MNDSPSSGLLRAGQSNVPFRRRARRAARRVGLDVHRYLRERDLDVRRARLLADEGVGTVVDGGANAGQWALTLRAAGFLGLILSFEPVSTAFEALERAAAEDPRWRCVRAALGDADGEAVVNVAGNSLSSSLLEMESAHTAAEPTSGYIRSERTPTMRLDTIVPQVVPNDQVLALKLDLQGLERAALAGADGILSRVRLVECELSLIPLYTGQTLYREMIELLSQLGFSLWAVEEGMIDQTSGRAMQLDGIFIRDARTTSPG